MACIPGKVKVRNRPAQLLRRYRDYCIPSVMMFYDYHLRTAELMQHQML